MAKYDAALRAGAASRSLAEAKAKKEEEDVDFWDVAKFAAGIGDIALTLTGMPPIAGAGVEALEGAVEGDLSKTAGAAVSGAKTYATHDAAEKKHALAKKNLAAKKEAIFADKELAAAIRASLLDKEEEEEGD